MVNTCLKNHESSAPSVIEGLYFMYYLYMIKNSIDKLYIGITQNPQERLNYHNSKRGAEFTKYKNDFSIVFLEKHVSITEARKREIQIKNWRREKKEALIKRYAQGLLTTK